MWWREDKRVARRAGVAAQGIGEVVGLVEGRRSAGVAVSLIQMVKNFANDFVLSNEGNDAQGPPQSHIKGST